MNRILQTLAGWRTALLFSIVLVAATLVVVLWPVSGAISAPGWTTPMDISQSTWGSYGPTFALDSQSYTHAVFWGNGETQSEWSIWYTNNRTGSWATPKKITTGGDLRAPEIVIDSSDTLHVIYEDRSIDEIMYVRSSDYGATWSTKYNLSSSSGKAYEPDLAVDGDDNLHAVWIDNRWSGSGNYQLGYAKRTGGSWGGVVHIPNTVGFTKVPAVSTTGAGANLRVHISFHGKPQNTSPNYMTEVYYVRYGTSWENPVNISNSGNDASYNPDIVGTAENHIYLVWDESKLGYHDIFMRRSTDNGTTWSADYVIVQNGYPIVSTFPSTAFGQGKAVFAYDCDIMGNGDVFYVAYDPSSGSLSNPLDLSENSGTSKEADVIVDVCRIAVGWQDKGTAWRILFSRTPVDVPPGPCVPVTVTPTPTQTPTPSPTPTPDPRPHGWVQISAEQPPSNTLYTRELMANLAISATSDVGNEVTGMKVWNLGDVGGGTGWIPFAKAIFGWPLLETPYNCEYKWVLAQFEDDLGYRSITSTDYIFYDNYVTATMVLNDGDAFANSTLVMITSEDQDSAVGCSGLSAMSFKEEGLTYTVWITYFPEIYFFLSPVGELPMTRTVYARYRDHAGNVGVVSDSIWIDLTPPYSGTAPILNRGVTQTSELIIPVTGLEAFDDETGVANVWFANRPDGPWVVFPYVPNINHAYEWNLAYGWPPIVDEGLKGPLHTVYVRYEDGSGYGSVPGNMTESYTGTISIIGVTSIHLPLVLSGHGAASIQESPSAPARLFLQARPDQAGEGEDVLLWLAARGEPGQAVEGMLRLTLPDGLRAVHAWSAYGELVQVEDHLVVSRERSAGGLVPWILVRARVEERAGAFLYVQAELTQDRGSVERTSLRIKTR